MRSEFNIRDDWSWEPYIRRSRPSNPIFHSKKSTSTCTFHCKDQRSTHTSLCKVEFVLTNLIAGEIQDLEELESYHKVVFFFLNPPSFSPSLSGPLLVTLLYCMPVRSSLCWPLQFTMCLALKWQPTSGFLAWLHRINEFSICSFEFRVPRNRHNWPSMGQVSSPGPQLGQGKQVHCIWRAGKRRHLY